MYSGIEPEDADFYYEQVEDGYILHLKLVGQITELNFNCICKRYEVNNPQSYRMRIADDLRFEQLIMTPISNGFWEVRIGTTEDRKCKSPARSSLKEKRQINNYENKLPRNCK